MVTVIGTTDLHTSYRPRVELRTPLPERENLKEPGVWSGSSSHKAGVVTVQSMTTPCLSLAIYLQTTTVPSNGTPDMYSSVTKRIVGSKGRSSISVDIPVLTWHVQMPPVEMVDNAMATRTIKIRQRKFTMHI